LKKKVRKNIYCLKCKTLLHPSDWEILKTHNTLPVCDSCETENIDLEKKES
jgi:NAD-dependent SIR2 family protein deacetylase